MTFTDSSLYEVSDNLGAPRIQSLTRQAGVISVLRVTAYYPERRTRHSVATIVERQQNQHEMSIIYEGFNKHQPLTIKVRDDVLDKVLNTLVQVRFDKLENQPDVSYKDHSLWLIQRASGTHIHGVIISPDLPVLPYSTIVNAVDNYLNEAIREIPLT